MPRFRLAAPRLWQGPMLLLIWQVAPVGVRMDDTGKYRVAVGFGLGRYINESVDCAGDVTRRAAVRTRAVGLQGDAWLDPSIRLSAGAGVITGASDSSWANAVDGLFGDIQLGIEGTMFGIGAGLGLWPRGPGQGGEVVPSGYARIGRAAGLHFRIDDNATAAPGLPPMVRVGVGSGFGAGADRGRWFLGVTGGPDRPESADLGFVGELTLRLPGRVQPLFSGQVLPGRDNADWNLGAGLRVALGRKP